MQAVNPVLKKLTPGSHSFSLTFLVPSSSMPPVLTDSLLNDVLKRRCDPGCLNTTCLFWSGITHTVLCPRMNPCKEHEDIMVCEN